MPLLFLTVKTEIEWINEVAEIPVLGHIFLFVLMFIPAVLGSFLLQIIIPGLNNDIGFTKAMLMLLPMWNILLWRIKIRLYLFTIPAWILLGSIAIVKGILLIAGVDDGQ